MRRITVDTFKRGEEIMSLVCCDAGYFARTKEHKELYWSERKRLMSDGFDNFISVAIDGPDGCDELMETGVFVLPGDVAPWEYAQNLTPYRFVWEKSNASSFGAGSGEWMKS